MSVPQVAFSGQTTTNDHFQEWKSMRSMPFTDHPSYIGSALFPSSERCFETSTNREHNLKKIPKKLQIKEAKGSLCLEGKQDFTTSNRSTFVNYPDFEPTQSFVPKQNEGIVVRGKLAPAMTQNQKDFVFHSDHKPPRPADCNPYLSKIENDMYPSNRWVKNDQLIIFYQNHM